MKLAAYMTQHAISDVTLAAQLGCSAAAVDKWRRGLRIPRADQMRAIFAATDGSVSANDFFEIGVSDTCLPQFEGAIT